MSAGHFTVKRKTSIVFTIIILDAGTARTGALEWRTNTTSASIMRKSLTVAALFALLTLLVLAGLWRLASSRTYQVAGELVARVDTAERVVALSFDDGPRPGHTEEVLRILAAHDVKATFYLVGSDVLRHPAQARAIVAAGHEVGNHSFSHRRMLLMSDATIRDEIERTDQAIRAAGYGAPLTFRPPYGKKLFGLPQYLEQRAMTSVTWDVEPESQADVGADPARITRHIAEQVQPGSIVLLHVMYPSRAPSMQALPATIAELKRQGYTFVTVSALLAKRTAAR
jgi:peptidoglycan-N-acetylglucosamine deacetylase